MHGFSNHPLDEEPFMLTEETLSRIAGAFGRDFMPTGFVVQVDVAENWAILGRTPAGFETSVVELLHLGL